MTWNKYIWAVLPCQVLKREAVFHREVSKAVGNKFIFLLPLIHGEPRLAYIEFMVMHNDIRVPE